MANRATGKRVLIVIRQFHPLAAGAETQALRQAQSYMAMGCEVLVVTARHLRSLPAVATVDGVPVRRLSTLSLRFVGSVVFLFNLALFLLLNVRKFDAVLAFHVKQPAMVAAVICWVLGRRLLISDQAAGEFGDTEALRNARLGRLILGGCLLADGFVSGSSDITEELVESGIPAERIHFIPNGIPLATFSDLPQRAAARKSLGLSADAFVVVNVGRHTAQKDLTTLLEGWREFAAERKTAVLLLVGDGDENATLRSLADSLGISGSVRFEGWRGEVPLYLAAADVFASCSISEGTHIALGEAMAAGLPVIATPVGGARDFVRDGVNGYLVPVGGRSALAEKLEILATDDKARLALGKAARDTAETELEQESTARKHLDILLPAEAQATARGGAAGGGAAAIVHVIATLDSGGSERQMAELAARQARGGAEVRVICLTRGGPASEILRSAGVDFKVMGKRGKIAPLCLASLVFEFLRRPPALVHTWLFTSNLYGRLAAVAAGVRHIVVSERSTDPWKGPLHRWIDRLLSRFTDSIVVNSNAVAASLFENGIPRAKVHVLFNGVDTERFSPRDAREARRELGLSEDGPLFGFIGRLAFEKRPELFLEAAGEVLGQVGDAKAVLFGDGPMRRELEEHALRLGERVIFFGDCDRVELAHAALDCLVLTSAWEGFPNVVLEAFASSRPVVAVRLPATVEIIENGVDGVLVDDSASKIAEAVVAVLADGDCAASMGRSGRRKVEGEYSIEKMADAYQRLYESVTQGTKVSG